MRQSRILRIALSQETGPGEALAVQEAVTLMVGRAAAVVLAEQGSEVQLPLVVFMFRAI
jgi:hypothetical protein